MKEDLLQFLQCPDCKGILKVNHIYLSQDDIMDGTLNCESCGHIFPVEEGIPRLLPTPLSERIATGSSSNGDKSIPTILDHKISEMRIRDKEANHYLNFFTGNETEIECRNVLNMLKVNNNTKVLEMGAGTGRVTEKYALESQLTIASDYSFRSLLICKNGMNASLKKKVHLVQADGTSSPFRDATFDRVLAAGVFMHIRGTDMRDRFLIESNRVLVPNGSLIITGKNYSYFYRRQGKKKEDLSKSGIYMFASSKSEFVDLLKRHYIVNHCRGIRYEIPKITKFIGQPIIFDRLLQFIPGADWFAEAFVAQCHKENTTDQ